MSARPPKIARWLLRAFPLGSRRDETETDLLELFSMRTRTRGIRHARWRYYGDVISLWRSIGTQHNDRGTRTHGHSNLLGEIAQDLSYGARLFRRSPAVVGIAVAGLGVAIGVGTTVFSLMNAVVLRPVGIIEPASAVRVFRAFEGGLSTSWPYLEFARVRDESSHVELEAAIAETVFFSTGPNSEFEETAHPMFVSGGFFTTLNNRVTLGRVLSPSDDVVGAQPVAVLSHAFWLRRFGADPSILGRPIWLNGAPFTVVGVSVRGFTGTTDNAPALWAPMASYHTALGGPPIDRSPNAAVHVVGRIAVGVPRAQAEASLGVVAAAVGTSILNPARERLTGVRFEPADRRFNRNEAAMIAMVFTIAMVLIGLVVLLACVNVANLLLASAASRQREMSMRLALGASRGRIMRQLLTESLSLGLAGGAIGLLLTIWCVPVLTRVANAPASVDFSPDAVVYAFLAGISVLAGLGAGLAPARHSERNDLTSMLKGAGVKADGTAKPKKLRATLIGVQAAASLVLLVLAALLTRGMVQAARVDVGFDANRILTISPVFGGDAYSAEGANAYWNLALDRARAVPGVQAASLSTHVPFGSTSSVTIFNRAGSRYTIFHHATRADYFPTLGLRIVKGRPYTIDEVAERAQVVVISDTLARDFFPGEDPVGQPLNRVFDDSKRIIIGVAADVITARLRELAYASVYYPLESPLAAKMIVRTSGQPEALIASLRSALGPLDSRIRLGIQPVSDGLQRELAEPRTLASLATVLAAIALALAVVGIYGVTAFVVGQRTQEIGIRMACGANAGDVLRLLVHDSLRPIVVGLGGGLIVALLASRAFTGVLYGLSSLDPVAFVGAALVLLAAAVCAVIVPTRHATAIEPAAVLREL